ncbi:MAG: hypothetical protein ACE5IR_22840 [bacterium]
MTLVLLILGFSFIGWGLYQIKKGSAYIGSRGGDLILYKSDWINKSDSPYKFWFIVVSEIVTGSFFIYFG